MLWIYYVTLTIFIGDFNINWLDEVGRRPLYNLSIINKKYRQLVSSYTTDNKTIIDHIYTNLPEPKIAAHILETYLSITNQYVL